MGDSRFDGILEAFDCALLEYVAGEEEGDCESDDCVLVVGLVGEAGIIVVVVVVVVHVWRGGFEMHTDGGGDGHGDLALG